MKKQGEKPRELTNEKSLKLDEKMRKKTDYLLLWWKTSET